MKTIGIDARFILRPLRGMPLYVYRICQKLPSLDRSYKFIYFINKGFEHNDTPENYLQRIEEIEKDNPNVVFINYDDGAEVQWEQIILPKLIKEYKINLLHMPGNRICFFPGVETVVTLHDIIEYDNIDFMLARNIFANINNIRLIFYNLRMMFYVWITYRYGFRRANHIITVSNHSAKQINEVLKIDKNKITPIYHGLDDDFLHNHNSLYKRLSFQLGDRTHVLMLGGDTYHKNPEGAIASWAKVPEPIRRRFPLKIIGFSGGKDSPLLLALNNYNFQDEVEIKGWVSRQELIDYMRSAALFLFLSRQEGFGFPPLHAMASGTPVVASNRTSIPEILGDVGYLFDPSDHNGISKGIVKLLTDEVLWKVHSDAGVVRSQLFRWENSSLHHMNVYKGIMGKSD